MPGKHKKPKEPLAGTRGPTGVILDQLAAKIETKLLDDESLKVGLSDYLKLLNAIHELEDDTPRKVTVVWKDPVWEPLPAS